MYIFFVRWSLSAATASSNEPNIIIKDTSYVVSKKLRGYRYFNLSLLKQYCSTSIYKGLHRNRIYVMCRKKRIKRLGEFTEKVRPSFDVQNKVCHR